MTLGTNWLLHSARAGLLAVALTMPVARAGLAGQQSPLPPTPPAPPPAAPSPDLWQRGAPTTRFGADLYRDIECRTLDKLVSLEWRYATPATPSTSNVKDQNSEVFATRYWPTFAVPTDSYHICVAGKARDGAAILEFWTFGNQSALGTPAPSCLTSYSTASAAPQYTWTLPPRSQIEEILRIPSSAPQGMIRAILPDLHSASKIYVYFDTSREVWSVDIATKSHVCAASPTAVTGAVTAVGLTNAFQMYWADDYLAHGHCYFFVANEKPATGPMADTLVCIDANRDGKIDSARTITATQWAQEGWGDPANLVQPHD